MEKKITTTTVETQTVSHMQIEGVAFYDEPGYFLFTPLDPAPDSVPRQRRMRGVAQQMTDGTFDFVPQPSSRANTTCICKLAHGRASQTQSGDIRVYLSVSPEEQVCIADTILTEAKQAVDAIRLWQMKR